jgi:hypothetical protein
MVAAEIPRGRRGAHETTTIVLLLLGGFLFLIGWFVGVVLLWLSDVWSTRDKLLGTFVLPGGLVAPLFGLGFGVSMTDTTCVNGSCTTHSGHTGWGQLPWAFLFVALVALPILVAVHLARTSREPS